jgi:hypothetical protein
MAAMAIPAGLRAVDLMLQIPSDDFRSKYDFLKPLLLDRESREQFEFPAQYMLRTSRPRAPRTTTWASRSTRWTGTASSAP